MPEVEKPRPVLRIIEKDPVTGAPEGGILDTASLSGRSKRTIKTDKCPDCKANFTRTVFTDPGRKDQPPYACESMKFASPHPKVNFAPPQRTDLPDLNVDLFLANAACKPIREETKSQ